MRHRVAGRKLGRTSSHRKAMFRNMATSLFQHERIVTTLPKAKELRPIVEKLITQGKKGTLHARRNILSYIMLKEIAHKVMDEIAPRYADRNGGYTRILKLGYRDGDKAEMAIIELVGNEPAAEEKKGGKKKTAASKGKETTETKKKTRKPAAKKKAEPEPVEETPAETAEAGEEESEATDDETKDE